MFSVLEASRRPDRQLCALRPSQTAHTHAHITYKIPFILLAVVHLKKECFVERMQKNSKSITKWFQFHRNLLFDKAMLQALASCLIYA